ncbi:Streptothricin acetyltransferase [Cladobotryum mycophilum]|uniref:Streptothricin acetyltransferase n=1 Tax=Cladobotryum mycophilum TaxID=491253 RepID=A0ABR0SWR9_9HYPO
MTVQRHSRAHIGIISLNRQSFSNEMLDPFLRKLVSRVRIKTARTPDSVAHLLRTNPIADAVLDYVRNGGTTILMGDFPRLIAPFYPILFFAKAGLPWDFGSHVRADAYLNPDVIAPTLASRLPARSSTQALFIRNARPEESWHKPNPEAAVTLASVGHGRLGYVGDPYDQLALGGNIITTPVPAFKKDYGFDESEFKHIKDSDGVLFTLVENNQVYGYAHASKSWNNMVVLEWIALDATIRGHSYGKQLLDKVIEWARQLGVAEIRLESQSNNIAACYFYKRCGFKFGGYDEFLYKGIPQHEDETALFWYYML